MQSVNKSWLIGAPAQNSPLKIGAVKTNFREEFQSLTNSLAFLMARACTSIYAINVSTLEIANLEKGQISEIMADVGLLIAEGPLSGILDDLFKELANLKDFMRKAANKANDTTFFIGGSQFGKPDIVKSLQNLMDSKNRRITNQEIKESVESTTGYPASDLRPILDPLSDPLEKIRSAANSLGNEDLNGFSRNIAKSVIKLSAYAIAAEGLQNPVAQIFPTLLEIRKELFEATKELSFRVAEFTIQI